MLANLRPRSVYDVLAAVGFFVAVSTGGAYAVATVTGADVVDESLTGRDVRGKAGTSTTPAVNGTLGTLDIGGQAANSANGTPFINGSLTGFDVRDNSLKGTDIDESTLTNIGGGGPAGGDLTGTYPNPLIAPDAVGSAEVAGNALTGGDIDESTLGQVPSALLGGFGRSGATTFCNPETTTFVPCAATEILTVPAGARALVFGRAEGAGQISGPDFGWGLCFLSTSSIGEIPNTRMEFLAAGNEDHELATLVGVTPPLPAGPTSFGINCNQLDPGDGGTISYEDISASVVLISGN